MGCIGSTGGSRMPARLWIRCTTQRFHRTVKKPEYFPLFVPTLGFFPSAGDACLSAYRKMPISNPAEREQEVFGPDTVAVLAVALEDTLRQLRLVDRNDPAVTIVAKTIIELARRGERDPVRLREQAIQSLR